MKRAPRIERTVIGKSAAKADEKKVREARWHVKLVGQIGICAATGKVCETDPHHGMNGVPRGMGYKAPGRNCIPLSRKVHIEVTDRPDPEAYLLAKYGVLVRELEDALWACSPDLDAMRRVVFRAVQVAQQRRKVSA